MPLNLSKPDRPVRVELLDVAPVDIIAGMSKTFTKDLPDALMPAMMKEQALDMDFFWVSETGPAGRNELTSGLSITPTHSFQDCPALDIAVIGAHRYGYTPTETELTFIRNIYPSCAAFLTICGGILVPLQAGILSGKTATGPRFELDMLRGLAPEVKWVEKRWVHDGTLWTSGALLNGVDMATAFIEETWGKNRTELVQWLSYHGSWVCREVQYGEEH
ncbi:hypothetical protein E4U55_005723 [Claviceps digitariae]|nr:hypothetical protein E4U55_005723 [Claviceps digitariae]